MYTSLQAALVVTRREVRDQFRDWRILLPLLLLALVLPLVVQFAEGQVSGFAGRYGVDIQQEQFTPFLIMVVGFFPVTVSLVTALESFVGEKERHSIEALLSSPLSDVQLYLGKLLASTVSPLFISILAMAIYLFLTYRETGWLPSSLALIQILLMTIFNGLILVCGGVVISTQTTSMRGANLLAAFIILPMALLLNGQSFILVWGNVHILWWMVLGEAVLIGLLIRMGIALFNREDLLGREFDLLNPRWIWATFWSSFLGTARSVGEWIRVELMATLRRLALPTLLMLGVILAGTLAGAALSSRYALPPEAFTSITLQDGHLRGLEEVRFFESGSVPVVWIHNLRTILLATLMGTFSLGVLAVVVLLIPFFLTGFFAAMMGSIGLSPLMFLTAFVLPHGILEIPAIVLAGAAVLRLGGALTSPAQGRSLGEVWLAAFADWTRVMIGLVTPLLLGAAILEVLVTPRVALLIFGQ